MESTTIGLFSEELNNFKYKSAQNWFDNNDHISYLKQKENRIN